MDAERRSRDHDYHHRDLKSMLQELKALTQEWKDNTHSSMAEARRLINLDHIQEQHEVISRSLAGSPEVTGNYQGEFMVSPFYPTLMVTLTLSAATVSVSFEQRAHTIQKRLQQLVDDIRVTAVRNGARFDDSVSAAEEVLQDITLRRSQNKRKAKLVFNDEDSEFVDIYMFPHPASTSSISSKEDKDGAHGQEVCQICFDSTPSTSPFLRVEGALYIFLAQCRLCL